MRKRIIMITVWGLFVLLLPLIAGAETSGTCGPDVTWVLDENGVLTISGTGDMTSHPWIASSVVEVKIRDGVTNIGDSAFYGCYGLSSITIPDSVKSIGSYAFGGCESLTSITIPEGVTNIAYGVFSGCRNLSSIIIPESVTSIKNRAFWDCSSLSNIRIPDGLASIELYDAFYNCPAIKYATLDSNGAMTLSKADYSFRTIGSQYDLKYIFTENEITGLEILNYDKDVTFATIPDYVTRIGYCAFFNCKSLTSIDIPDNITSIGDSAFLHCSNLSSINIPDSITSIGSGAFSECISLTSIIIPDSVTSIEGGAFSGCSGLSSITIPDSVTNIGGSAFSGCSGLSSVTIPYGVTSIEDSAFYNCGGLTSIIIPDSVTSIERNAFYGCRRLSSITIPEEVTSIGNDAFYECISLTSITFPDSVTEIKLHALPNTIKRVCILSTEITIEENAIPYNATLYCYSYSDAYEWGLYNENHIELLDNIETESLLTVSVPEYMSVSVLNQTGVPAMIFPRTAEQNITWESSDESILKVNKYGVLTPVKTGTATISLIVNNIQVQSVVTVTPVAESISIDYEELYVVAHGHSAYIPIHGIPSDVVCHFVAPSSDEFFIYSEIVNGNELIIWGQNERGRKTLTITDVLSKCSITVPVLVVRGIKNINVDKELFIPQGDTEKLNFDIELSNGIHTTQPVNLDFSIENSDIATVNSLGMINALTQGNTNLYIKNFTETGYETITVPVHVTAPQYSYLPANLLTIEEESFYGSDFVRVIIPDGCQEIGSKAFAYCEKLKYIYIPASVTTIAEDAFEECSKELVIERTAQK